MGMPDVVIAFEEAGTVAIKKSERGLVALIIKDKKSGLYEMNDIADIPKEFSTENQEQIKIAFAGYVNAPKKVLVCVQQPEVDQEPVDYSESLKILSGKRFDYLVIPTVETDGKAQEIASWIKSKRQNGKKCKAVLPNVAADTEGVINFTTKWMKENEKEYTTEQYCARIAGIIAGTPMSMSCSYADLRELTECEDLEERELQDAAIDSGELILYNDGEKIKIARGVNSLTTITAEKGKKHKKIKTIEAIDMIYDDIKKTCEDSYIGKYTNSYDNKCILISAIMGYLGKLTDVINVEKSMVEIDVEANKQYLKEKGIDVTELSEEEIKMADTDEKVFLRGTLFVLDAMEDIYIPFTM